MQSNFAIEINLKDMKKYLKTLIVLLGLLPISSVANSATTFICTLSKMYIEKDDDIENSRRRQRIPSYIECVITSNGLMLSSNINTSECQAFEIWYADGEICIASYSDESSFIDGLFSMTGEFQVRFIFPEFELVGNIEI